VTERTDDLGAKEDILQKIEGKIGIIFQFQHLSRVSTASTELT
jgi:hypothetical protein